MDFTSNNVDSLLGLDRCAICKIPLLGPTALRSSRMSSVSAKTGAT